MGESKKLPDKEKNSSEWYTEILREAEICDVRYDIKGHQVYLPWGVETMELMYSFLETELKKRGHTKYWYPALIPEKNFHMEASHVEGFTPEVYWVEKGGTNQLEERLALRPTSETAFYSMFSLWIRSYKDLPMRTYQRANVFRYETKATRPMLRDREFYWIETHCAFATEEDAYKNVLEDMESTKKIVNGIFGVPTIVFKRPRWDTFAGANNTFGADAIMPSGKVVQLPSTHMLGTNFSKPFNVKFQDKDEKEKFCYLTCYGPAVSRIMAALILIHGDNKGLRLPWEIAPTQVIIVPILAEKEPAVLKKAKEIAEELEAKGIRVAIDESEKRTGEKFYYWEMKGVPIRIEVGPRDLKEKKVLVYRRDTEAKDTLTEKELVKTISKIGPEVSEGIKKIASKNFDKNLVATKNIEEVKKVVGVGIARAEFCSVEKDGVACAEKVEKETGGKIRGTRIDVAEKPKGNCIVCGKKATEVVYIAKDY